MSDAQTHSPERTVVLTAVLDTLIPPSADGRMPGAGALGLGAALAARAEFFAVLDAGLAALDEVLKDGDFAALDAAERRAALEAAAAKAPVFVPLLYAQACIGYYQDPCVRAALGMPARPPFPQGYEVPETDFSILDPVRAREPFWRDPGGRAAATGL